MYVKFGPLNHTIPKETFIWNNYQNNFLTFSNVFFLLMFHSSYLGNPATQMNDEGFFKKKRNKMYIRNDIKSGVILCANQIRVNLCLQISVFDIAVHYIYFHHRVLYVLEVYFWMRRKNIFNV